MQRERALAISPTTAWAQAVAWAVSPSAGGTETSEESASSRRLDSLSTRHFRSGCAATLDIGGLSNTSPLTSPTPSGASNPRAQIRTFCRDQPKMTGRRNSSVRPTRSEEHTSELQSRLHLVCRLLLEKKKTADHLASTAGGANGPLHFDCPTAVCSFPATTRTDHAALVPLRRMHARDGTAGAPTPCYAHPITFGLPCGSTPERIVRSRNRWTTSQISLMKHWTSPAR